MSRFVWMVSWPDCSQQSVASRNRLIGHRERSRPKTCAVMPRAAKTAAEYSQQTKEEFQKDLDARLNELDAEIAKLREKGAT